MVAPDHSDPKDELQEPVSGEETAGVDVDEAEESSKLDLQVSVEERGACERHVSVTVPREDIEQYFEKEFDALMAEAQVPGFRVGHAPRKLVERRFRKDVSDRVKANLLSEAIAQVIDEEDFSAISEPDVDFEAVTLPEEGPMAFEFDIEVRPEFDVPQWKGLKIERPVRDFTEEDVDNQLQNLLAKYGRLVPSNEPASSGDYITTNLEFRYQGNVLSSAQEEVIRLRPTLSFRDGKLDGFDELMEGVKPGETRSGTAELSEDAPNPAIRGQEVEAQFEVLEVKKLELPELTEEFISQLGDFADEGELRDAVRDNLQRQLEYEQHQRAREQITSKLTVSADWELPPDLLERQSQRELQRAVLELQRSGFSEDEIRAHENEIRRNSRASTARALKEHFILERIAEQEEIEVSEADVQMEIQLIAAQSGESARRVRARLEKSGAMDALHNQVIERKVIQRILAEAEFEEVPYEPETPQTVALDQSAGGRNPSDIPEAKPEGREETSTEEE
jgi:trigger factor